MAIFINSVQTLSESLSEPVSLTDAKAWIRVQYDTDDDLIADLISSARKHLEMLCSRSFVNKLMRVNIELTGTVPNVWIVDLPYGPTLCIDEVKIKDGFNTYTILVKNEDYEVVGNKLWLYTAGYYTITYQAGYSSIPSDLQNDLLTLVAWMYENRGKKFQGESRGNLLKEYPNWDGLNYSKYQTVVI